MSRRLLFVTTRLPWPENSGRKVSLTQYCRGLHERYGYEIALFVFPEWDSARDAEGKPPFISQVHFAAPISRARKCVGLAGALLSGKPLQQALYTSGKNRRLLQQLTEEFKPDVVMFDMIRLAPYMKALRSNARRILDLDDLLSVRYARQLKVGASNISIAGYYAGGLPTLVDRALCRGALGRLILKAEQKRVERAEIAYSRHADGVVLVSAEEAKELNRRLGEEKAVAVPLGVSLPPTPDVTKQPRTFGFVGNMHVAANVASLDLIVREILPKLTPPFTFEIAGPIPSDVRARFKDTPGLTFLGEVPSLAPVLASWQFSLCPIAFGSGLKTKVLEAMAAELPALTNTVGAEGIGAESGKELIVENDPCALARAANALLDDPLACQRIGREARTFVTREFSWERAFDAFSHLNL